MRGRIRSGDGRGGGKRSGRRFRVEESALDRLLGRSVPLSGAHTGRELHFSV